MGKRKYGKNPARIVAEQAQTLQQASNAGKTVEETVSVTLAPPPEVIPINAEDIPISDIDADRSWNARSGKWDDPDPNARDRDDENAYFDLRESIRINGVQDPVEVRQHPKKGSKKPWSLVAGFRRLQAAIDVGLDTIPAHIKEMSETEAEERNVIENLGRKNLKLADQVFAVSRLFRIYGSAPDDFVARKLSMSNSYVSKLRRIGELPGDVISRWRDGKAHVTLVQMGELAASHKADPSKTEAKFQELTKPKASESSNGVSGDPLAKLKGAAHTLGQTLGQVGALKAITFPNGADWEEVVERLVIAGTKVPIDGSAKTDTDKLRSYRAAVKSITGSLNDGVAAGRMAIETVLQQEADEEVKRSAAVQKAASSK